MRLFMVSLLLLFWTTDSFAFLDENSLFSGRSLSLYSVVLINLFVLLYLLIGPKMLFKLAKLRAGLHVVLLPLLIFLLGILLGTRMPSLLFLLILGLLLIIADSEIRNALLLDNIRSMEKRINQLEKDR